MKVAFKDSVEVALVIKAAYMGDLGVSMFGLKHKLQGFADAHLPDVLAEGGGKVAGYCPADMYGMNAEPGGQAGKAEVFGLAVVDEFFKFVYPGRGFVFGFCGKGEGVTELHQQYFYGELGEGVVGTKLIKYSEDNMVGKGVLYGGAALP